MSRPWEPGAKPDAPPDWPTGLVTFLYTDIEGSTRRWELFMPLKGPTANAVRRHDEIVSGAVARARGRVFRRNGDGFCIAFDDPSDALKAAHAAQRELQAEPWDELRAALQTLDPAWRDAARVDPTIRARMAIHVGTAEARDGDYFGGGPNRAARLLSAGHGGQVLVSGDTENMLRGGLHGGVELQPLGRHRLKDLLDEMEVFQLRAPGLAHEFAPLNSLNRRLQNLPWFPMALVGRVRVIDQVVRLVSQHALVTLTGFAGVGKTRLAVQTGAELLGGYECPKEAPHAIDPGNAALPRDRKVTPPPASPASRKVPLMAPASRPADPFDPEDGVWFVDLLPVTEPAVVPREVAKALTVREQPPIDVTQTLVEYLKQRKTLLILDNCEHVQAACVDLIKAILNGCPNVRVLATSRQPLRVIGGAQFRVKPMEIPNPDTLAQLSKDHKLESLAHFESIQLFVGSARLADAEFIVDDRNIGSIVRICHAVNGLPLAIRFAAVLAVNVHAQTLAERLDTVLDWLRDPEDHGTDGEAMDRLIDRSHAGLDEAEKALLRRLAVFGGAWTLEAAETICAGGPVDRRRVLALMASLVSKSLVEPGPGGGGENPAGRYQFLEVMRQYAHRQLALSDERREFEQKHLNWCVEEARRAGTQLDGPDQKMWLDHLELEHENFRAAFGRATRTKAAREAALTLAAILRFFWCKRGYYTEGARRLREALARDKSPTPSLARGRALAAAGYLAECRGEYADARAFGQQALQICEQLKDPIGIAHCELNIGLVDVADGDYDSATRRFNVAMETFIALENLTGQARVMGNLGQIAFLRGEPAEAMKLQKSVLALAGRNGDHGRIALAQFRMGLAAIELHDYDAAESHLVAAIRHKRALGDLWGIMVCLEAFGWLAAARLQCTRAGTLFGAAQALRARIGTPRAPAEQRRYAQGHEKLRELVADDCGVEAFGQAVEAGEQLTWSQSVDFALQTAVVPAARE